MKNLKVIFKCFLGPGTKNNSLDPSTKTHGRFGFSSYQTSFKVFPSANSLNRNHPFAKLRGKHQWQIPILFWKGSSSETPVAQETRSQISNRLTFLEGFELDTTASGKTEIEVNFHGFQVTNFFLKISWRSFLEPFRIPTSWCYFQGVLKLNVSLKSRLYYLALRFRKNPSPKIAAWPQNRCGIPWNYLLRSNSHHQDYSIFFVGNPNLNLPLWLESWVGG